MKLLANENFPKASVALLRSKGYDVLSVGDNCPSVEDEEVIELAIKEERLIMTFDKDYGELIFRRGMKPEKGIIFLRMEAFIPEEPAEIIHKLIKGSSKNSTAVTLSFGEGRGEAVKRAIFRTALESKRFVFEKTLTVVDKVFLRQRQVLSH